MNQHDQGQGAPSIEMLFEQGQNSWPGIELKLKDFSLHLSTHWNQNLPEVGRAADLYLACACSLGVPGAFEAFDRTYLSGVERYIARLRPPSGLADEVRQVVREKLFMGENGAKGHIATYSGNGALLNWVRVTSLRVAINLQKRLWTLPNESQEVEHQALSNDAELGLVKGKYRQVLNDAFRMAIRNLSNDQVDLLRKHHIEGVTLDALAVELNVHRATVARRLANVRRAVLLGVQELLRAKLSATPSEVESALRMAKSQLEWSLSGLLPKR